MNWAAAQKRIEAARKREERQSLKRQKEIERLRKDQAKLSAQEQARLEVEAFENSLDVLLSIHKEASAKFDWMEPLCALPPHAPVRAAMQECIAELRGNLSETPTTDAAHTTDDASFAAAQTDYEIERDQCEKMRSLAKRVLAGEARAYGEALTELSAFGELSTLGSSISFTVHHPKLIECVLGVNGRDAIPADVKTLTAAGKVSIKPMPKARYHEVYQDYVCGCALRVAREVLALLPVENVIVTATVTTVQASTGRETEIPILSVAMPRTVIESLDFAHLDPSDSLENFTHCGDVTASRKSGEFVAIVPLAPADVATVEPGKLSFPDLLRCVREMRMDVAASLKKRESEADSPAESNPTAA